MRRIHPRGLNPQLPESVDWRKTIGSHGIVKVVVDAPQARVLLLQPSRPQGATEPLCFFLPLKGVWGKGGI